MRIDPFHLRDDARKVDLFGVIKHRRAGMMGQDGQP